MATLEQAQADVASARTALTQKRQETSQAKSELRQARARLPERQSEQALRQRLAGLSGRIQRRAVKAVEEKISGEESKVKAYEEKLTEFEETKLRPVEAKIKKAKEYERAVSRIRKLAIEGRENIIGLIAAFDKGVLGDVAEDYFKMKRLKPAKQEKVDTSKIEQLEFYTEIDVPEMDAKQFIRVDGGELRPSKPEEYIDVRDYVPRSDKTIGTAGLTLNYSDLKVKENFKVEMPQIEQRGLNQQFGTRTDIGSPEWNREQEQLRKSNLRADALAGVPAQYLGTIFDKPISEDLAKKGAEGNFGERVLTFLDPKYQYEISKEEEQRKKDLIDLKNWNKRIERLDEDYAAGKISDKRYNAVIAAYQNAPAIKRLEKGGVDAFTALARSETSSKKKIALSAGMRASQILPYFAGAGSLILGTEMARTGIQAYEIAETREEKRLAQIQTGLGIGLGVTGVTKILGGFGGTGMKITGSAGQQTAFKAATYGSGAALGTSIGAVDYYSTLARTKDRDVALGAALGTGGTIIGGMVSSGLKDVRLTGKKPYKVKPTAELEKEVSPYTRQRATILLKDEKGRYILGKTKSGQVISIGGGIEKGQTPRQAALAELGQETGLTLKQLKGFKKAGKVVFPEETNYLFVATVPKGTPMKAASDVKSFVTLSPKNPFVKGSTGQTWINPVSKKIPFKGEVRSYELGLINYMETGKKPTWLAIDTKQGRYFLGTQSRYDVPYKSQSKYLSQEELKLAHGTPDSPILKRFNLGEQKRFTVQAEATKRGATEGLYVQPPAAPGESGYIGLSYVGLGSGKEEIIFGSAKAGKRAALLLRESPKVTAPTPKTFSGMESELIIPPKSVVTTTSPAEVANIGLRRVYLQPSAVLKSGKNIPSNLPALEISSTPISKSYISPGIIASPPLVMASSEISETDKKSSEKLSSENMVISSIRPSTTIITGSSLGSSIGRGESYIGKPSIVPSKPIIPPSEKPPIKPSIPPSIPSRSPQKESYKPGASSKSPFDPSPSKPTPFLDWTRRKAKMRPKEGAGGGFEILQVIKGKTKKTGERETLGGAAKSLSKGLKGGLQASGFIVEKKTGRKIKAGEILPLLGSDFRVSKKDIFKIVEKKEKRLRKGTTGKEVQYFRKKGGKKSLLGL